MYAPRELQHCRVSSQVNLPRNAQGERVCHFVSVSFLFFFLPVFFFCHFSQPCQVRNNVYVFEDRVQGNRLSVASRQDRLRRVVNCREKVEQTEGTQ